MSFTECELSGCGFEDVVFEGCTLADLALLRCSFVRCRFVDGSIAGLSAVHSQFTECSWASLEAPGWTLDDCELIRCTFEDTRLSVLHASQCLLGCTITRGTLTSADITECKGDLLAIVGAEARGVRGLGLDLGKLALTGLARGQIALGQCTIGELVLSGCGDLTTFSLVGCKLRLFDVQSCPSLQSVTVRATQLDAMRIAGTSLADTTFEDVTAAGPSLVERSALAGVFFKGGVWTKLALRDVELSGYLAVAGTRFVSLIKDAYREEGAIRRRLEDDQYGPGSMTWRAPDGS